MSEIANTGMGGGKEVKALTPEDWMLKIVDNKKRDKAMETISHNRRCSVDPHFWDEVQRLAIIHYNKLDEEQQRIDEWYKQTLPEYKRESAKKMVDDWVNNLSFGYKQIEQHLKFARTEQDMIFWKYVRRELNKRRMVIA